MHKMILGAIALTAASAANAAVSLNFNSAAGPLGFTHDYTVSGKIVTAAGFSANGAGSALFGKTCAGVCDENGLGLAADPSGDNEMYYPGTDFIQVDVHNLFSLFSGASFFMGSSTDGETWKVYGSNAPGTLGTLLFGSNDENPHNLTFWGQYTYYDFAAGPAVGHDTGNVLLGGFSLTPVPEPSTWALMLLGFGATGIALRRKPKQAALKLA